MASTVTGDNLIALSHSKSITSPVVVVAARRRIVSRESGRAIEMLGHAIEYLADEFALECMSRQENIAAGMHPRVVAIEILKKCNRVVYLSCPEAPRLGERVRSWLRWQRT
jgi:hypothetical protein